VSERARPEPVAAAPSGELEPSEWLLELGAASRTVEYRAQLHSDQGRPLRAWTSRRAGARARRQLVQQALAAHAGPFADGAPAEVEAREPVAAAPAETVAAALPLFVPSPFPVEPLPPADPAPIAGDAAQPELETAGEPVEPLLSRIGAYTAAPRQVSVH
jgi:hypothetical protein